MCVKVVIVSYSEISSRERDLSYFSLIDTGLIREAENVCMRHVKEKWKITYLDIFQSY